MSSNIQIPIGGLEQAAFGFVAFYNDIKIHM